MDKSRVEEILIETEVLLNGHFILTSGKHSNQYMQCAKITQYPKYSEELCKGLAENFKDDKVDVVVGPATGGIIISYEIARQLGVKNLFAERENGKMTLRRGFTINKGDRVLIAEDVITTGGSVQEVIDIVNEMGGIVVGVAILVNRSMGKVDFKTKLCSAYTNDVKAYEAHDCPLCKEGLTEAIKPGSRSIK